MVMSLRGLTGFALAGAMMATAATVQAVPTVVVTLGPPVINGSQAELEVSINFSDTDNPNAVIAGFQLDVSQSDASLTTPDFFRFSFTPDAAVATWDSFVGFPTDSVVTFVPVDASVDNLAIGTHTLGVLNVNLGGLPAGSQHAVSIGNFAEDGTFFFFFDGEQVFDFVPIVTGTARQVITVPEVTTPAIPEPATLTLGTLALAGLAVRRRRA